MNDRCRTCHSPFMHLHSMHAIANQDVSPAQCSLHADACTSDGPSSSATTSTLTLAVAKMNRGACDKRHGSLDRRHRYDVKLHE